ncbi:exported hypothetical protein [uncultured Desulfatiglans sp.]|uniref:Uncharacterized protein n=1 Tax=Uncultured Desulfatiglans sp. TaxID=1748965 RepID=A0A653A4L4_UNCDX|nr:exported hypothetical protein [uncultured Desulfatiglans sp.]
MTSMRSLRFLMSSSPSMPVPPLISSEIDGLPGLIACRVFRFLKLVTVPEFAIRFWFFCFREERHPRGLSSKRGPGTVPVRVIAGRRGAPGRKAGKKAYSIGILRTSLRRVELPGDRAGGIFPLTLIGLTMLSSFQPGNGLFGQSRRQSARLLVRRPLGRLRANA